MLQIQKTFLYCNIIISMLIIIGLTGNSEINAFPPEEAPPIILNTPQLSLRIVPDKAWTLDSITHNSTNKILGLKNSNYGYVVDLGGNKFVGSGHTEGGQEIVQEVTILADGQSISLNQGGMVNANTFEIIKHSIFYKIVPGEPLDEILHLTTTLTIANDTIHETHNVTISKNRTISKVYAFMYAWAPTTTDWIAKTHGGLELEGFLENSNSWKMKTDIRWSAIYEPDSRVAILTSFPDTLEHRGKGIKHAYWDLSAYHKQYFQPLAVTTWQASSNYSYEITLKFISIPENSDWKEIVRADAPPVTPVKTPSQIAIETLYPEYSPGEQPEWNINPVGMAALDPDTVLKPWNKIKVNAQYGWISVWNRTYSTGPWSFPRKVTFPTGFGKANPNMFVGESSFDLKLANGTIIKPATPWSTLFFMANGLVQYRSQVSSNGVNITATTSYEFDGFTRTDIELTTQSNVIADKWELVLPFNPEHAKYFSIVHASKTANDSQQQNSKTKAIPDDIGTIWASDFSPVVWIGNRDSGLCWYSESKEYWSPEVNPEAIRIIRTNDKVELRISIIASQTQLPATMKFSFGMMATPVKPRPVNWRSWTIDELQNTNHNTTLKGNQVIFWDSAWRIIRLYPHTRNPSAFRTEIAYQKANGVQRIYPYVCATYLGGSERTEFFGTENFDYTTPEWKAFGPHWQLNPNVEPITARRMAATPNSIKPLSGSFANFHLSVMNNWIQQDGVNGVYIDEAYPYPGNREEQGMGFTDSQGIRQPTYQIYAMRDYYKRLTYLFQQRGIIRPSIMVHASGVLTMPYLSFADMFIDGEQMYYPLQRWLNDGNQPSYIDSMNYEAGLQVPEMSNNTTTLLDWWAAEFTGRQFGFVPVFLPEFRDNITPAHPNLRELVAPTRDLLAVALLHDVLIWPLWCKTDEIDGTTPGALGVNTVRHEFEIGDSNVLFHPFWEVDNSATTGVENVLVSTYTGNHGILAVVSNLTDSPQNITVNFNNIFHIPFTTAWNAQTGIPLSFNNRTISLTVPARDFVLIRAH